MQMYNKLVRDNIPNIIKQNGQKCVVKKLDQTELRACLDQSCVISKL